MQDAATPIDIRTSPTDSGERRIVALDGLRGVAVLMVMAFHFHQFGAGPSVARVDVAAGKVLGAGWAGVELFFVLSGFFITGILLGLKDGSGGYFGSFYSRRVLRIFPLYFVFLIIMLIALPAVGAFGGPELERLRDAGPWQLLFAQNIWILAADAQSVNPYGTVHLWSLAVEEQFYLVWPLAVLLLGRRGLVALCVALVVMSPLLRLAMLSTDAHPFAVYVFSPVRADALAVGALLAVITTDVRMLAIARRAAPAVLAASVAAIVVLAVVRAELWNQDRWVLVGGLTPIVFAAGALMVLALSARPGSAMHRTLSWSALVTVGRYSFALYVLHYPVTIWLSRSMTLSTIPRPGESGLLQLPVFSFVAFAISFALAWVSWRVIEAPFLRLRRQPERQPADLVDLRSAA